MSIWFGLRFLCWRSRTERGFSGNKGLHVRSGAAASCEPARKIAWSEGSLRSKPAPAVAFLCFLSLAKQRKEVPRAGIRRNGEQGRHEEGYLKFGKPPEPQPFRMLCGLSLAKSLIKNTLRL